MRKKVRNKRPAAILSRFVPDYRGVLRDVSAVVDSARRATVRAVNALMSATYWEIGRRIVECEQRGGKHAAYGDVLITRLSSDLSERFGRGFAKSNLYSMRALYLAYPKPIFQTTSGKSLPSTFQTASGKSAGAIVRRGREPQTVDALRRIAERFPLPWSHYARLVTLDNRLAREFYETEAMRGGWTVRQLTRQIESKFYERTALSRDKAAMLRKGGVRTPADRVAVEEQIRDPALLEFLNLKDEYSENDLESAILERLQSFLMEMGRGFAFVARQHRCRFDHAWYRIDLIQYHRVLRRLVLIDLKLGSLSHEDVGQMHMYLNYAKDQLCVPGEGPPIGLILCEKKGESLARYTLGGLDNTILSAEFRTRLPRETELVDLIRRARASVERRAAAGR